MQSDNSPDADLDEVEVTVYYLEMHEAVRHDVPAPREGLQVLHARQPSVPYYRFLYNTVGQEYRWLSRRILSDEQLAELIQHPQIELHVLHVDGCPAGFAELDRRVPDEVELVQFGLMPEFVGQGLGKWFLQWTIDQAWSYQPRRFWLHTCTLDHPNALRNYRKAGFQDYDSKTVRRKW